MGWGAEVAAIVQERAFDYLDAPVERVGAKFTPLPFAPVMEQYVVPHVARRRRARSAARWGRIRSMAKQVTLPRLGQGMESGTVVALAEGRGRRGRPGASRSTSSTPRR